MNNVLIEFKVFISGVHILFASQMNSRNCNIVKYQRLILNISLLRQPIRRINQIGENCVSSSVVTQMILEENQTCFVSQVQDRIAFRFTTLKV